jgi:hypothetical protein
MIGTMEMPERDIRIVREKEISAHGTWNSLK